MKPLTICITCCNDALECNATIRSIRDTSKDACEIIVVDDASDPPLELADKDVTLIRCDTRVGVGPGRHLAATAASGDVLLITDSHMRFTKGWYEAAMKRVTKHPHVAYCGTCLGLSKENMDVNKPQGEYNGATMLFHKPPSEQINVSEYMEPKWTRPFNDDEEIPCMLGAVYFLPTEFFFHVGGLRMLRGWGSDEMFLSLKWWLAGGEIRMLRTVRVGHQFRNASPAPYRTDLWKLDYNKLMTALVTMPKGAAQRIMELAPNTREVDYARNRIAEDAGHIQAERALLLAIQRESFDWFLKKFNLSFP